MNLLREGPKFCIRVNPSRSDVVVDLHAVAAPVPPRDERASFADQALKRLENVIDDSLAVKKRDFRKLRTVKREGENAGVTLL